MKALLKNLPDAPGVYLMKNKAGEILYVGKARSLKKRVSSYFSKSNRDTRLAARHLGRLAKDVDFIVTDNETEAFILENNLIKKHKPFYNIQLKDDKTFLCLRVDMSHPFPSIVPVRRPKRDGRLYFGPYASARALGRNPSAAPKILTSMILAFLFAEGIALIALLMIYNLFK